MKKDAFVSAALAGKPLPCPVIDIHGHMGPLNMFHIPESGPEAVARVMDACGVAMLAFSSHYAISATTERGNDYTAEAAAACPGRFLPYAVANPNYPDDVAGELKRCFDTLGMRLIKLHPGIHRCRLMDKGYEPAYRFAAERGAPVLMHTWDKEQYSSVEQAALVARRHPDVTFIWGHGGAPTFDTALRWAARLENVYVDTACSQVFNGTIEHFLEIAPVEKILFASDLPFISLAQQLGKVVFSDISDVDKRKILRENAEGVLRRAGIGV